MARIVLVKRSTARLLTPLTAGFIALASLVSLAGCGAGSEVNGTGASGATGDRVAVLASFYPLQYVAQQVGGEHVDVTSLTPPGTEPHDLELSPRQVRTVGDADLVVYLSGFQAAVDDAVTARRPTHLVDAADDVTLRRADGESASTHDPHFWLDPSLLARLAGPVAQSLAEVDPTNASTYAANADRLEAELTTLDSDFSTGLRTCKSRILVTSHAAFGYLAARYDLEQVAISGLDPEAEPSPARLREIADLVKHRGVTTVFSEELLSPKVAQTLASDAGVTTKVLDPVESQTDSTADYRGAMEKNLATLRAALGCA